MSFKSPIPIRVFQVYIGIGTDDPQRELLVTCRSEDASATVVRTLEQLKRDDALVVNDGVEFFAVLEDVERMLPVEDVSDAIGQGYLVRSVVVSSADAQKVAVLATIAGAKADPDKANQGG